MQSHFHSESQGIITSSENSLKTCSQFQIMLGKDFPKALLALNADLNFSTALLISYCLDG